jgi:hypothetical protein
MLAVIVLLRQRDQLLFVAANPVVEVSEMLAQIGNGRTRENREFFGRDDRCASNLVGTLR